MTLTAVVLIAVSAILHAGWNTISKRAHPTPAFFFFALVIGTSLFSPILIINFREILIFPAQVWLLLAMTGLCEAIYFVSLSAAYRSGDMSIAYPLARSAPVIIVILITLLLGQGTQISSHCIAGIMLIFGGSIVLPMHHFTDFRLKNYFNLTCFFALCTALATAGYSMIDFRALQLLRDTPDINLTAVGIGISYVSIEFFIAALWLGLFTVTHKSGRNDLQQVFHRYLRPAVLTGVSFLLPYTLVLISMAHVANVSYVVAFRQLSIPLGVIFGIIFLKEPRFYPKYMGTLIIFIGLVFVALG
jgi:uncharacterized membrane protein